MKNLGYTTTLPGRIYMHYLCTSERLGKLAQTVNYVLTDYLLVLIQQKICHLSTYSSNI